MSLLYLLEIYVTGSGRHRRAIYWRQNNSTRELKNISERKMSLDLGHSASYIHSIACGKALPSMSEFLYICEYLVLLLKNFFDENCENTTPQQKAINYIRCMYDEDASLFFKTIERMK